MPASHCLDVLSQAPFSYILGHAAHLLTKCLCPLQVQGVGSYADILQGDIPACGPSFIHIIDHVLLPFNPKASTSSTPAPAAMEMSPTSVSG